MAQIVSQAIECDGGGQLDGLLTAGWLELPAADPDG